MKIIVFAGGVGSRLWPLSRKKTPKQFGKILGEKSTLQEAVARLQPAFDSKDIYVATGEKYKDIVIEQLPQLPRDNFIFEPVMRDVGPAIGLASFFMEKIAPSEPVAIIWSDHLVRNIEAFQKILANAERIVRNKTADFVFIGQKPRFANQNIGWIELGEKQEFGNGIVGSRLESFKYRPKLSQARDFYESGRYVWNLGYFVTTPKYLVSLFKQYVPQMHKQLKIIQNSIGTYKWPDTLNKVYPTLEKISFDDAILEKLPPDNIYILSEDLGWSDIGAWEALKEALENTAAENVTKGNVLAEDSEDCLIFNYNPQLVVGIDLADMIVVNTPDVMLVCPKTSVPKIKKFVEKLEGTPNEHLA